MLTQVPTEQFLDPALTWNDWHHSLCWPLVTIFRHASHSHIDKMAEPSTPSSTTVAPQSSPDTVLLIHSLYTQSPAPLDASVIEISSSDDDNPLEPLSSDEEEVALTGADQLPLRSVADWLTVEEVSAAHVIYMPSGISVSELARTIQAPSLDHACANYDSCMLSTFLPPPMTQGAQKAVRAAQRDTDAAAAAAVQAALVAAQDEAREQFSAARYSVHTYRGSPCHRRWQSCPFTAHALARQATGLPVYSVESCPQHSVFLLEQCSTCLRRRRLCVLHPLSSPLK